MDICSDITTLRTITPGSTGDVIYVTSYYSGQLPAQGGGLFIAQQDSTIADDGAIAIRPAINWIWIRSLERSGTISPYMFGAKGDGVNDITGQKRSGYYLQGALTPLENQGMVGVRMPAPTLAL
ncbi:hypothetical protein ACI2JR_02455 [Klebsiella sp. NPDC088457]